MIIIAILAFWYNFHKALQTTHTLNRIKAAAGMSEFRSANGRIVKKQESSEGAWRSCARLQPKRDGAGCSQITIVINCT